VKTVKLVEDISHEEMDVLWWVEDTTHSVQALMTFTWWSAILSCTVAKVIWVKGLAPVLIFSSVNVICKHSRTSAMVKQ